LAFFEIMGFTVQYRKFKKLDYNNYF